MIRSILSKSLLALAVAISGASLPQAVPLAAAEPNIKGLKVPLSYFPSYNALEHFYAEAFRRIDANSFEALGSFGSKPAVVVGTVQGSAVVFGPVVALDNRTAQGGFGYSFGKNGEVYRGYSVGFTPSGGGVSTRTVVVYPDGSKQEIIDPLSPDSASIMSIGNRNGQFMGSLGLAAAGFDLATRSLFFPQTLTIGNFQASTNDGSLIAGDVNGSNAALWARQTNGSYARAYTTVTYEAPADYAAATDGYNGFLGVASAEPLAVGDTGDIIFGRRTACVVNYQSGKLIADLGGFIFAPGVARAPVFYSVLGVDYISWYGDLAPGDDLSSYVYNSGDGIVPLENFDASLRGRSIVSLGEGPGLIVSLGSQFLILDVVDKSPKNPLQVWHNQALPQDVNGDGKVNYVDALEIADVLSAYGAFTLPQVLDLQRPVLGALFYDVNNDGLINANDLIASLNKYLTTSGQKTLGSAAIASLNTLNLSVPSIQNNSPRFLSKLGSTRLELYTIILTAERNIALAKRRNPDLTLPKIALLSRVALNVQVDKSKTGVVIAADLVDGWKNSCPK